MVFKWILIGFEVFERFLIDHGSFVCCFSFKVYQSFFMGLWFSFNGWFSRGFQWFFHKGSSMFVHCVFQGFLKGCLIVSQMFFNCCSLVFHCCIQSIFSIVLHWLFIGFSNGISMFFVFSKNLQWLVIVFQRLFDGCSCLQSLFINFSNFVSGDTHTHPSSDLVGQWRHNPLTVDRIKHRSDDERISRSHRLAGGPEWRQRMA